MIRKPESPNHAARSPDRASGLLQDVLDGGFLQIRRIAGIAQEPRDVPADVRAGRITVHPVDADIVLDDGYEFMDATTIKRGWVVECGHRRENGQFCGKLSYVLSATKTRP